MAGYRSGTKKNNKKNNVKKKVKRPNPKILGTGMARKAAEAAKKRRKLTEEALKYK